MNMSVTMVKAVEDAPNSAIKRTKGENLMSANVSGPNEPAAEYGFQNGLSPDQIA
jgi:hypothetical protein